MITEDPSIINDTLPGSEGNLASDHINIFRPENINLVSVLQNDTKANRLILHTRFGEDNTKDAVVILQKSSFPNDVYELKNLKVVNRVLTDVPVVDSAIEDSGDRGYHGTNPFPLWKAETVMSNDIYYHLLVTKGLESVNGVNMSVIYPADSHHLRKYTSSRCHIIQETPQIYRDVILPFLNTKPKDLSWVDNIIKGIAEDDRVIYTHADEPYGFTLVLDYRWDGSKISELHCLAIAHDQRLTCLRDLRSEHVSMLKEILQTGRSMLSAKYSKNVNTEATSTGNVSSVLSQDQIIAYLHYPPTFYRLHVHFTHVDAADEGTRVGRAHLLDEVIRNLEQNSNYYSERTMTIYLRDNSPMLEAIRTSSNGVLSDD